VRVRVDRELCVGHGRCYELAPEIFGEDERGHCVVSLTLVPPELAPKARQGAANCPERAILVDADAS
jgi:ferredoxin